MGHCSSREFGSVYHSRCDRGGLGSDRTTVPLFGNLATGHQQKDDHCDLSDGISKSEIQNKDSKAIHLKLNELLASHEGSSNRLVDSENLTEKELDRLHHFYAQLSTLAEEDNDLTRTHSIDAAEENHYRKSGRRQIKSK